MLWPRDREGKPDPTDFRIEPIEIPTPGESEVLLRVLYLSLDPYMRGRMSAAKSYAAPVEIDATMEGGTVAEVIASNDPAFQPGDIVLSHSGWQTHAVAKPAYLTKLNSDIAPVSTALGVLGMPGFTAYTGLLTIGQPKPGETVVVARSDRTLWGRPLARLPGSRAPVQSASPVVQINVPTFSIRSVSIQRSTTAIPTSPRSYGKLAQTVSTFISRTSAGAIWEAVWPLLNTYARVPVCGLISQYNATSLPAGPDRTPLLMRNILTKSLTIRGFINSEFASQRPDFLTDMSGWMRQGKMRYREDIVEGLENAPEAFIGMLEGKNFGKLLIKVS